MKTIRPTMLAVLALCFGASAVQADTAPQLTFEAGVSTQGLYLGPKVSILPQLDVRTPIYYAATTAAVSYGGADYQGDVQSRSFALMADYQPFSNGLRISGGIAGGGYSTTGTGLSNLTLEGTTYTGTFDVKMQQKRAIAPVVSMGYSKTFNNGWSVLGEVGGKFVTYDLTATSTTSLGAMQAQFDADIAAVNSRLGSFAVTPFVTVGLGYRF